MENALFVNNKSNYPLNKCIESKQSDNWEKDKPDYSLNSYHEVNSKNSKRTLINNDKNTLIQSTKSERENNNETISCNSKNELCCHVKLNTFLLLKDSTKQLLCLLEEMEAKVHTNNNISVETLQFNNVFKYDLPPKDDHDDCSVYKRLIRKCHCLNHPYYNDFVIHFNEESKFTTSNIGELIKNMRILRKFLYIGDNYTKNALRFLYEGVLKSERNEKLEIIQGCAHADICNIFDEHSIVTACISWPCKYKYYGNCVTQNLAASFLYKLAEVEQGRRYLCYSSKIANDIRKVLRKKSSCLEINIVHLLNATLNLLQPIFSKNFPVTCFTQSVYEGDKKKLISRAQNTFSKCTKNNFYSKELRKIKRPKIIPEYTQ